MTVQAKETIELLDGVFSLVDATRASLEDDGKITISDVGNYFGAVLKLPAAIGGINKIPKELAELSPASRQEVIDYFAVRFDLSSDELEVLIEDTLRAGYEFATSIINLAKYKKTTI